MHYEFMCTIVGVLAYRIRGSKWVPRSRSTVGEKPMGCVVVSRPAKVKETTQRRLFSQPECSSSRLQRLSTDLNLTPEPVCFPRLEDRFKIHSFATSFNAP